MLRTFSQEIRAAAWVETDGLVLAVFYRDEFASLERLEGVSFWPAKNGSPKVKLVFARDPIFPWDRSTSLVPFRFDPSSSALRKGQLGWVVLPAEPREFLVVSSNAVIDSPEGPYVIGPDSKDGRTLTKRPLELGRVFNGVAVVMSGLRVGEPVVAADTFFLDAERRLRAERDPTVKGIP
jgi:multidrug efflux pump subunit AcrA (membrane-fusion protein)